MRMTEFFSDGQIRVMKEFISNEVRDQNPADKKQDFIPVKKWCDDNSISVSKIYNLRKEGQIDFYNFGKNVFLKTSEVEKLMEKK